MAGDVGSPVRYALVTGASSGMGAEFAKLAAADGFTPILVARREALLRALADNIKAAHPGINPVVLPCDLAAPGAPAALAAEIDRLGFDPEVLVNDAGIGEAGPALDMDPTACRRTIEVNVQALTELTLVYARRMTAAGRGRILNIASIAGFMPCPYMTVLGASKGYVLLFTEGIAQELRGSGVTATALCPGFTRTPFLERAGAKPFVMKIADDPHRVALAGWRGMMAGKTVVTPGLLNKLCTFSPRLLPRAFMRWIAAEILSLIK